ncbi:MAG: hypothetical protein P8J33_01735, partial [Pirellulaceae bacterium]|nr:hypothetical protein [Pirellulaceae bacterium]
MNDPLRLKDNKKKAAENEIRDQTLRDTHRDEQAHEDTANTSLLAKQLHHRFASGNRTRNPGIILRFVQRNIECMIDRSGHFLWSDGIAHHR